MSNKIDFQYAIAKLEETIEILEQGYAKLLGENERLRQELAKLKQPNAETR